MRVGVVLTEDAERILEKIYGQISASDSRQNAVQPYCIFYRVVGGQVIIYVMADGRRDMQTLLSRPLLGA
jgi:plasmid stabilization system protein ParE